MAKKETKETYKESKQYAQGAANDYAPLADAAQARASGGQDNPELAANRDEILGAYRGMASGANPIQARTMSGVGAIDVSDLKNTLEEYKKFRDTGGLSSENIERMRGMGGFDEFAKTGGYTDESIANIKAQAISPIGSYASGTRDELARRASLQGGYAPGFDAASRQLRRDTARGIADTSLNANVAIQDRVNAGRQWGISGLTDAEGKLAGMQTGNRLAALGGETNVGGNISQASAADRANQMAVSQFNAMQETGADQFNQGARERGISGLSGMYGADIGLQQGEYDRQLAIKNAMNSARGNYLGNQSQLAVQPGIGGNLVGLAGSAAGIAGGMMTGGATSALGGLARNAVAGTNAGGFGLQAPRV
jgi:hypothetical protein